MIGSLGPCHHVTLTSTSAAKSQWRSQVSWKSGNEFLNSSNCNRPHQKDNLKLVLVGKKPIVTPDYLSPKPLSKRENMNFISSYIVDIVASFPVTLHYPYASRNNIPDGARGHQRVAGLRATRGEAESTSEHCDVFTVVLAIGSWWPA